MVAGGFAAHEKQLPYQLHNFYVELMGTTNLESAQQQIVRSSSGREELLLSNT